MIDRYNKSEILLDRALQVIPSGAQIFSKSIDHLPKGVSPFFIVKGKGSATWDVDGNEYLDFINSLAAINLGHSDKDVTSAVLGQLENGVIFSLSHPIEIEVAEEIVKLVPCAEKVRFFKNGSDATTAAIRLARAFTGRDRIAVASYHGWQDWHIGSSQYNIGVPKAVCELTHKFEYNNLESLYSLLHSYPKEFAAIVLEPLMGKGPKEGFLDALNVLAHQHGAIVVYDEIVSGFRCALGGAQECFGTTPDLVALGKGMANGYPLAALAGKADIMKYFEKVFIASTFSGEILSLTASLATLNKIKNAPVINTLTKQGQKVIDGLRKLIHKYQLADAIRVDGHPTQSALRFGESNNYSKYQIRTFLVQELFANGILCMGVHNMSYAHSNDDISRLLSVYDKIFFNLSDGLQNKKLEQFLRCRPLVSYFQIKKIY